MGRYASAIAFLASLLVVLLAAGCGQRFERAAGEAPEPGDLAADALVALEDASSAHFVLDVRAEESGNAFSGFTVHLEGDASAKALDVQGSVGFGGASFQGRLLASEHAFFVEFMGRWYGDELQGIADAVAEAKREQNGELWNELATAEGLRRNFDQLFEGEVSEGPVVDDTATWQFEGRLNADGIADFAERYGVGPSEDELEEFRLVADASRIVLVVGQEDHLPRRLELAMELSEEDAEQLQSSVAGAGSFTATLELSEFGKTVAIEAPAEFRSLDELFRDVFGGLG
jgi:hypothetical protein